MTAETTTSDGIVLSEAAASKVRPCSRLRAAMT